MNISGFQKLTLLDFPGKVASTIFTTGCQLRCPFCHNASLVTHIDTQAYLDPEEILSYLKKRKGVLDGVCVTGGEPLLQPDLPDFLREIRQIGLAVKLDTNGACPERLKSIVDEGLVDYVAMDIKNALSRYPETVGITGFDTAPIEQSIRFLMTAGIDYEFRTTVVKEFHTIEDIADIAAMISGARQYWLQGFVDSGDLIGTALHAVSETDMQEMCKRAAYFVPNTKIRGI